MRPLAASAAE
jgi:hypothetical protein